MLLVYASTHRMLYDLLSHMLATISWFPLIALLQRKHVGCTWRLVLVSLSGIGAVRRKTHPGMQRMPILHVIGRSVLLAVYSNNHFVARPYDFGITYHSHFGILQQVGLRSSYHNLKDDSQSICQCWIVIKAEYTKIDIFSRQWPTNYVATVFKK